MKKVGLATRKETDAIARNIKKKMEGFSERTLGSECKTPGLKIRSKGRGRGLARGKGRGPLGIPIGYK
jgi:hypothetical protein